MPDFTMLEHLRRPWSFDEPDVREWAARRIEALEKRLELVATGGDGKPWPVEIGDMDGIGCRNETIAILQAQNDSYRLRVIEAESKLDKATKRIDAAKKAFCVATGQVDLCDATKETQPISSSAMLDLEEALFPGPFGGNR